MPKRVAQPSTKTVVRPVDGFSSMRKPRLVKVRQAARR
jgi:hypothetical protein